MMTTEAKLGTGKLWATLLLTLALAACGGGADKSSVAAATTPQSAASTPAGGPVPTAPSVSPPSLPTDLASEAERMVPAWARNYAPLVELYVSPTGNDANSGSSRQAA